MFDFSLTQEQRRRRIDETLSAIEAQDKEREKVETATAFLSSTDRAEIDGLEDRLVSQGRYVGQPELVWLLTDWLAGDANARISTSPDGVWLRVRGTQALERQLLSVQTAGERSATELNSLATALRDEREISICLDQETSRTSMAHLLTANHPLVRAALRVPGYDQARFGSVRMSNAAVKPGRYFVLVALARWSGVRPSAEFWTAAEALDGGSVDPNAGDALLAALADAGLDEGLVDVPSDLDGYLRRSERQLLNRQMLEQDRRLAENRALARARQISIKETYALKIAQIDRRIETIRKGRVGGPQPKSGRDVILLHEAQKANQDRNLRESLSQLEATSEGAMDVEYVAACVIEVTN